MNSILIKNALLADGTATSLLIADGVIQKIGTAASNAAHADRIIDAAGKTVLPSFVDCHAHFREPGQEHKEDIASGARAAVKGGFGAVACMPNTDPTLDSVPLVTYVAHRGQEVGLARVYPIGAITAGQKGTRLCNLRSMKEAGAIAFSDDGHPVANANLMRNAMMYAAADDLLIISHAEEPTLSDGGCANEGANASLVGLPGISRTSEEVAVAREVILAADTGARVHIAHVSTRRSVEIIRIAKAHGIRVTCETCPHYFAATDKEILNFNTNAKINPPLRTDDDVAAIIEGLKDGTIDCIATDHAPHHLDDKRVEFARAAFGTTGLETAFAIGMTALVLPGHLTLSQLVEKMSESPARILGLSDFGSLKEGGAANLIVANLGAEWKVDAARLESRGKNSLFDGWTLTGRIALTVVDGQIKYEEQ